ncbi:unnamed protein product [Chrysodeixis includens]|uniref:Ribosomal protein n=1 Tax=Chrysodeixis includens TaxID=689277 RepID=A0A9N8Q080_CHRIL|nr:unnamed protein product [Chrysodeixis includens]
MQRLFSSALRTFSSLRSLPNNSLRLSMFCSPQQFAQEQFLLPSIPMINSTCSFKVKGHVRRRCKSCYFVVRDERLYVICPKSPRHKQMSMKPKPINTWMLTHATQGKARPW